MLAEVVRSGFVEGVHRGSVVGLAADGTTALAAGDPAAPVFPRSASKPLQAAAMVELGLDLDGELLALAAASHSGEPFHLDGVRRILAGAGLDVDALRTPPEEPYDVQAARDWLRAGHGPEPLTMNCSGKHAAMLATCVVNGWDTATYLDPEHPLQVALRAALERYAGEPVAASGVDGCGAPVLALTLTGLAGAVRGCVLADPASARRRVVDAMRAYPEWVGGTRRDVTALMRGVPGLVAKDGAEGVEVAACADGRAVAVKIDDGASRARQVVTAGALLALGFDHPVLAGQRRYPLSGGGRTVGEVRAVPLTAVTA
ncbi:MAG: asparaginase [Actinomycetes bacterium]